MFFVGHFKWHKCPTKTSIKHKATEQISFFHSVVCCIKKNPLWLRGTVGSEMNKNVKVSDNNP